MSFCFAHHDQVAFGRFVDKMAITASKCQTAMGSVAHGGFKNDILLPFL